MEGELRSERYLGCVTLALTPIVPTLPSIVRNVRGPVLWMAILRDKMRRGKAQATKVVQLFDPYE